MKYKVLEDEKVKIIRSPIYNYNFDKSTGYFERWGKDKENDPMFSPFGPEILDIEITTICNGIGNYGPCPFCYKANTNKGTYMSFDAFKKIFDKLPNTTNQIAFGVDAKCKSNPDTFKIMEYTRENGVIPNVTVADVDKETAKKLAGVCGAVAVSRYQDKEICYDTIQRLADAGLDQINIHQMISLETLYQAYRTIDDYCFDDRVRENIKAIVFLSLKTKGRGKGYIPLSQEEFDDLVNYAMDKNVPIGFDSCSAPKLMNTIKDNPNKKEIEQSIEPCESTLFSLYCDVNGEFYPCSFCEQIDRWDNGISGIDINDFISDVWNNKRLMNFGKKLVVENKRSCPIYNI